jgi:hypothetical protein
MQLPIHPGGIVCFLQNAWSPLYAGGIWPRASWLKALAKSRSGQRLRMLIDDLSVCDNTTPIVGKTPDSVVEPDPKHIFKVLDERKPQLVIACGKQAEEALLNLWGGSMLIVPHPSCRVLTNDLYEKGRRYIQSVEFRSVRGQIALRQLKDRVMIEDLTFLEHRVK